MGAVFLTYGSRRNGNVSAMHCVSKSSHETHRSFLRVLRAVVNDQLGAERFLRLFEEAWKTEPEK